MKLSQKPFERRWWIELALYFTGEASGKSALTRFWMSDGRTCHKAGLELRNYIWKKDILQYYNNIKSGYKVPK